MLTIASCAFGFAGNAMPATRIAQSTVSPQMALERKFWMSADGGAEAPAASGKQDFLEAEPYWDQSTVPVNTYKNKS
eukprot:1250162-Prymnesium_polylepis.1